MLPRDQRAARDVAAAKAKRGDAVGTRRALAAAQSLTLVCAREGCASLVHFQSARRQAGVAKRDVYAAGDGCGSRMCSRTYHRA